MPYLRIRTILHKLVAQRFDFAKHDLAFASNRERYLAFADARMCRLGGGTAEVMRQIIGNALLPKPQRSGPKMD